MWSYISIPFDFVTRASACPLPSYSRSRLYYIYILISMLHKNSSLFSSLPHLVALWSDSVGPETFSFFMMTGLKWKVDITDLVSQCYYWQVVSHSNLASSFLKQTVETSQKFWMVCKLHFNGCHCFYDVYEFLKCARIFWEISCQ